MSDRSASVLVTGASGFIGRHLVEALLARGHRVAALCRPRSVLPPSWRGRVERIDSTDCSLAGLQAVLRECRFDRLFHLAAYGVVPTDRDDATMVAINARWPADLVRLCAGRGAAMVMTGSSAEYRPPQAQHPLSEDDPLETQIAYGASKARGTVAACEAANDLGVRLRVLRLFNVYGPGEAGHRLLPSLVRGLAERRRIALSEGSQIRDFVYVGDVVEALLAAADHAQGNTGAPARIWNVATGRGLKVREFAEMTARLSGEGTERLGFGDLPMRPGEIAWLVGDPGRMRAETGWTARHDLSSGLAASLARMSAGPETTGAAS